jgi:hypothetical protein
LKEKQSHYFMQDPISFSSTLGEAIPLFHAGSYFI